MKKFSLFLTLLNVLYIAATPAFGQQIIEGGIFESGNRGFLNQVSVNIFDPTSDEHLGATATDENGLFKITVPERSSYKLTVNKDLFHEQDLILSATDVTGSGKLYAKIKMERKPGYLFEITLAEKRESEDVIVDAIKGARIEVWNNTTETEELVLIDHPNPDFKVNLIKDNHYTVLIRKKGYLTKRMEAFVNVNGCILCFEGVGKVEPGVADNLTKQNSMGTLLANVELEKAIEGKKIELKNIYFDLAKWDIRPDAAKELDKAIVFLKDNPTLMLELGAHTDSRGTSAANGELSAKRARSTANYLIENGEVSKSRLSYRGYGEQEILNRCTNGVECSEAEHSINRRTELKILGSIIMKEEQFRSLKQMKFDESKADLLEEILNQEQVKIPSKDIDILDEEEAETVIDTMDDVVDTNKDNPKEKLDTIAVKEEMISSTPKINPDDLEKERLFNLDNKKIEGFTGYKIVIRASQYRLADNHEIIQSNKEIIDVYRTYDGQYFYMLGNFKESARANDFLVNQIKTIYPDAFIQQFENGLRTF